MADEFSRCQDQFCGIGGKRCHCCNMYFGKDKKKLNRLARKKLKRLDEKDIEKELTPES